MTLHDELKHYEAMGVPKEEYMKTYAYLSHEAHIAARLLGKILVIELLHPILRFFKYRRIEK